eukprot:GEMP01015872.1.p1 GENE.GEMP01015872.1~~GEMP01015872.1.p1  ORF type:complete len:519 (+),score=83.45 GEMP01015872.1:78-1634(+)
METLPVAEYACTIFRALCQEVAKGNLPKALSPIKEKKVGTLEIQIPSLDNAKEDDNNKEGEDSAVDAESTSWNTRLEPLVKYRQFSDAWKLIDEMKRKQLDVHIVLLISLVKHCEANSLYITESQMDTVFALTANAPEIDAGADDNVYVNLYNVVLDAVLRTKDTLLMRKVFDILVRRGFVFAPSTMGNLIKAFGNSRDFERVMLVWDHLRLQSPSHFQHTVSLGCVLDACVKCNRVDKAIEIFQLMKPLSFHRNTVLYTTMIKAFAKTKDLHRALALKEEMDRNKIALNLISYNSLIDVCVRCENLPMAAIFLREMQCWNIQPDIITFSTLIKGYCQTNALNKALLLVQEAKARNLKVDEIMFNSLLDGCATAKSMQLGINVFNEMVSSNIMPSCVTFSILVRIYASTGHIQEATDLVFHHMPNTWQIEPNSVVYTVLYKQSLPYGDPFQVGKTLLDQCLIPRQQLLQILHEYENPMTRRKKGPASFPKTQWTDVSFTNYPQRAGYKKHRLDRRIRQ